MVLEVSAAEQYCLNLRLSQDDDDAEGSHNVYRHPRTTRPPSP